MVYHKEGYKMNKISNIDMLFTMGLLIAVYFIYESVKSFIIGIQ